MPNLGFINNILVDPPLAENKSNNSFLLNPHLCRTFPKIGVREHFGNSIFRDP